MPRNDLRAKIILEAEDRASKNISKVQSSFKRMGAAIRSGGLAITAALVAVAASFRELQQAATLEGQTRALERQLADQGVAFDSFIAKLKEVSDAQIATAELVKSSGKALLLGIPADKIAALMEVARASAVVTGDSIAKAFDDIATGVGRASPLILDNLGIVVKLGPVYDEYAAAIGKTAAELTSQEQKTALLNEVLEVGASRVKDFTDKQVELGAILAKVTAAVSDWKDGLTGVATDIPDFIRGIGEIASALEDLRTRADQGDFGVVVGGLESLFDALLKNLQPIRDLDQAIQEGLSEKLSVAAGNVAELAGSVTDLGAASRESEDRIAGLVRESLAAIDGWNKGQEALQSVNIEYGKHNAVLKQGVQSNIDFTRSMDSIISQFRAEQEAAGVTGRALDNLVKNFTTMTLAVGDASKAYATLIRNQNAANRAASESAKTLALFKEEAERLGIVLEQNVNAEIEKNNAALEKASELYRAGEISAASYRNAQQAVAEENERLRRSLEGVSEKTRDATGAVDDYAGSLQGSTERTERQTAANIALADSNVRVANTSRAITSAQFSTQDPLFSGISGGTFQVVGKTITQSPDGRIEYR